MKLSTPFRVAVFFSASLLLVGAAAGVQSALDRAEPGAEPRGAAAPQGEAASVAVQYLEIVTPAVAETCEALGRMHGVEFSDPVPMLGNARTADLKDGGRLGVRAPMRATETPIVRPYVLVDDIEAAVEAARKSGATVALPPIEIPGQGTFSVYILGGIEHGLWEL